MKNKIILWVSRHKPIEKQINELKRIFGKGVKILIYEKPFDDANEIYEFYKNSQADEMVIVAPLSVIAELIKKGVKPLWAEMEVVKNKKDADVIANGRFYRFKKFKRIKEIVIEFEEL